MPFLDAAVNYTHIEGEKINYEVHMFKFEYFLLIKVDGDLFAH